MSKNVMRRKLIWMPVAIITFLLGVGSLLLFNFPFSLQPSPDLTCGAVTVDLVHCTSSAQFPGRSVELKKLQASTSGYFPAGLYGGHWRDRDDVMNTWY